MLFTVFTPTYNRAHTLQRVFDSLSAQTIHDFEWLIVDDGSTDSTSDLINEWSRASRFPIIYFYQKNRGNHTAYNVAVKLARGDLFLTLDSDDACTPDALETFQNAWYSIPANDRPHYSGITAQCIDERGRISGNPYPEDPFDSDALEMRHRYKILGEKWGFHRTDVMRNNPFPEPTGATFVPEDVVWNSIARQYKTRFINNALRVYFGGTDQLSRTPPTPRSAVGLAYWSMDIMNNDMRWFQSHPTFFIKHAINYVRFSLLSGAPLGTQFRRMRSQSGRVAWMVALPFGAALFVRDRLRNHPKIWATNSSLFDAK